MADICDDIELCRGWTKRKFTAALDNYFTYCAPYFAYAILCYGLGVVMGKLTNLTHVMSLCLESTQEEKEIEK